MACETKRELERMKLKDCPFCGSEAEFKSDEFGECVCCKSCGASLSNGVYGEEGRKLASADWNSRPIEDELRGKIEKLEAENKRLREALESIKEMSSYLSAGEITIYDLIDIHNICCDALKGESK